MVEFVIPTAIMIMHVEQAMGAENIVYILIFQRPIVMLFIC